MDFKYNNNEKALIFLSMFDLMPQKIHEILSLVKEPSEIITNFNELENDINNLFVKSMKQESQVKGYNFKYHKTVAEMKKCYLNNQIENFIQKLNNEGIKVLTPYSDEYPIKLLDLEYPPQTLYCLGDINLIKSSCIGIVGTRTPTPYGKIVTEKFTKGLCENGFTIVSGLASGVDSVAHTVALNNNGKTIAILGGGFENIFPSFNINLAKRIINEGLLVSEYQPSMKPTLYTFPLRNRIIAGISLGVLITEAGEKSGALHTKEFALNLGREVFAVPGNINSSMSKGTNRLIRSAQGACVLDYEDIVCVFKEKVVKSPNKITRQLNFEEQKIIDILYNGETTFEDLLEKSDYETKKLNSILTILEIKGIIKQIPGNCYILIGE